MKLTKERQKETGAFYTPKIWADKAVEYMRKVVPNFDYKIIPERVVWASGEYVFPNY